VRSEDLEWVVEVFIRQVYPDDPEGAHLHFGDHAEGGGSTFLAFVQGELAGYITIRWQSEDPLFRRANSPRIHDLLIFSAFQRPGVASRLMDEAEALIATRASKAGITEGLFDAYGPVQLLFHRYSRPDQLASDERRDWNEPVNGARRIATCSTGPGHGAFVLVLWRRRFSTSPTGAVGLPRSAPALSTLTCPRMPC
jgi:GNAT superfamily N-acetyltransferase